MIMFFNVSFLWFGFLNEFNLGLVNYVIFYFQFDQKKATKNYQSLFLRLDLLIETISIYIINNKVHVFNNQL